VRGTALLINTTDVWTTSPDGNRTCGLPVLEPNLLVFVNLRIRISLNIYMLSIRLFNNNTVTCTPIARQRFGNHVPVEANGRNNRTSIAKQLSCKHASLTIEHGVFRGVLAEELS
jgi:hypothetical protein